MGVLTGDLKGLNQLCIKSQVLRREGVLDLVVLLHGGITWLHTFTDIRIPEHAVVSSV